MGFMLGYLGYRDIETLAKFNQKLLVKTFHLTVDRVPSYSTIRRIMILVNISDLINSPKGDITNLSNMVTLNGTIKLMGDGY